ncbi:MAG: hypothetical protein CSYNP_00868 [Syntrophus sp. SKADARSKE-3]|nr:hypothetical protein [Syntrophus sp. SKADARSKE-3]
MTDKEKSKKQLIHEYAEAKAHLAALEKTNEELKSRNKSLVQSEAKYRLIADHTYDWEFWLSPAAEFIYTSLACERITGYKSDAFASDPTLLFRIIHPDDLSRVSENLHRKRAEIGVCKIEFRIIRLDGEERRIALAFNPVYDENGQYQGIRGSNRDITNRKRMENGLLREQASDAISILVERIANDLDKLLGDVKMKTSQVIELLRQNRADETIQKLAAVEDIHLQAQDLFNELLHILKTGAGRNGQ